MTTTSLILPCCATKLHSSSQLGRILILYCSGTATQKNDRKNQQRALERERDMEMDICRRARWIIKTLGCWETGRSGETRLLVGDEGWGRGRRRRCRRRRRSPRHRRQLEYLNPILLPPPTPLFFFHFLAG
jgi:hypothetical protein